METTTAVLLSGVLSALSGFVSVVITEYFSNRRSVREASAASLQALEERRYQSRLDTYSNALRSFTRALGTIPRIPTMSQQQADAAREVEEFGMDFQSLLLVVGEKSISPLLEATRAITEANCLAQVDRIRISQLNETIAQYFTVLSNPSLTTELRDAAIYNHGIALKKKVDEHREMIKNGFQRIRKVLPHLVKALVLLRRDLENTADENSLQPMFDRHSIEIDRILNNAFQEIDNMKDGQKE